MLRFLLCLEPISQAARVLHMAGCVGIIIALNAGFGYFYDGHLAGRVAYHVLHGLTVGGTIVGSFYLILLRQAKLHRQLSELSRVDALTGLNNRRRFMELAGIEQKSGRFGVLLLLDADNFKLVNDTFGHNAGDECLKTISYMLRRNVRADDVIGRIGGEEFAIFLSNASLAEARCVGERLTRPIPYRAGPDAAHQTVTLSVGAVMACSEKSLDSLFAKADLALYQAKAEGRARMVFWKDGLERASGTTRPMTAH